jgi:FlaA1/EpsC-like NDP-sugar epimerase
VILVTGAKGSVGRRLVQRLLLETKRVYPTDLDLDITNRPLVLKFFEGLEPKFVFHLAGAKHAFEGELEPMHATEVNVNGTMNVLDAAESVGAKVIFSSTCKACDPETAYGATKLIAERLVLNAGGVVVRFYNIPESDGNVFRLWETIPKTDPIPFTDCWRYFISMEQALDLTLAARDFPCGRYVCDPGLSRHMQAVAEDLYPRRETIEVPRRRGDRFREPLRAECEEIWPLRGSPYCEVKSPYDVRQSVLAAA